MIVKNLKITEQTNREIISTIEKHADIEIAFKFNVLPNMVDITYLPKYSCLYASFLLYRLYDYTSDCGIYRLYKFYKSKIYNSYSTKQIIVLLYNILDYIHKISYTNHYDDIDKCAIRRKHLHRTYNTKTESWKEFEHTHRDDKYNPQSKWGDQHTHQPEWNDTYERVHRYISVIATSYPLLLELRVPRK